MKPGRSGAGGGPMADEFFPVFETIDGANDRGLVLLADHARAFIPQSYDRLGLPPEELTRHIAYDIGVEAVTRRLAENLGVPAVMAGYSRLLIDPNRDENDPTLIRQLYDGTIITGNYPMSAETRANRIEHFYRPYHQAVSSLVANVAQASRRAPFLVSVHSFTPHFQGKSRPWHVGILWDTDDRAASPLIELLRREPDLVVGDNEPYDGALPGDTMNKHGTGRGYPHALIELRQDLIASDGDARDWADRLSPMLDAVNQRTDIHEIRHFASRTDRV